MGPEEDKRLLQLAGAISLFTTGEISLFRTDQGGESTSWQPVTSSSPAVQVHALYLQLVV